MKFQCTPQSLGFGVGKVMRFLIFDSKPLVRWIARLTLLVLLLIAGAYFVHWFISFFMSFLSLGLILWAIGKGDLSKLSSKKEGGLRLTSADGYRYGEAGYGYYINGYRIDADADNTASH
ncbi:DUF3742 family protein [Pseudomonas gessardii]|jgi:hypothetical protein|uniref:DUF3742 family protein n=1 Tax=Pseudomonas gessardii TaxID=78544 RepID=A0A7Y1QLI7_9PSED|nr:DUF3742 family protein [Pseudomonas gessardii]MRU50102.1 DUF3742 family protein [Pseudomonas gessardii]NNA95824.1 DUF3742 family protein [Pseudomonas gessardii]